MRKSKYHSRKVTANGETYDSIRECERHSVLKILERAGKITDLQRQVKFQLIPVQRCKITGKVVERACSYIADFTYYDEQGNYIVEDSKGYKTAEYKLKRKMMMYFHGIRIKET